MIDRKKVKEMIDFRKWHSDCGGDAPEEWWTELADILSKDINVTKEFLKNSTDDELNWICEVFEEISSQFQSEEFVDFLKELQKQHSDIDMEKEIQWAKYAIED